MRDFMHISDAAQKVVDIASRRKTESVVHGQLREIKRRQDCQDEKQDERIRELQNFQRRCLLKAAITDMRKKEGDMAAIEWLSDTLKAIGGNP